MKGIAPMLGAIVTSPPKAQGAKRAGKSKGEKSVTQHGQQHGELLNSMSPKTDRQMVKEHAKSAMRSATHDWVAGRISTKEHSAVHARAKHVLSGKQAHEFKGKSGERKRPAGHATNGY